jgi:NADPH:quinone reductase-like Zn-dependent oxidoreductase
MKAIVYSSYGSPDVLRYEEVETPVPKESEVLIRIRAASANPLDWHFIEGKPFLVRLAGGLRKPKIGRPGVDVAGVVESAGKSVTQFKPGDEVFGVCRGAFAEYGCAAEDKLTLKPAGISFDDAASLPVAAITALQGLRDKGRIQAGQKVLIDGASGGVGTFAVQIAKWFGAEVTAVCSTGKMETARLLGADRVIDYTKEDFTKGAQRYDLIFAPNAFHSIFQYRRSLVARGICVIAGGGMSQAAQTLLLGPIVSLFGGKKMTFVGAKVVVKDLIILKEMLESGKVVPVIDKRYTLREVPEAIRYLADGHARGKIVITF